MTLQQIEEAKYFVISYRWYGQGAESGWGSINLKVKNGKLNQKEFTETVKSTNSDFILVVPITITEMTEQQFTDWVH